MRIKSIYKNRDNEKIIERWNDKASTWDEELKDMNHHLNLDNAYNQFIDVAKEQIEKELDRKKRVNLLDLACGTGIVTECLTDYFEDIVGIDISDQMIDKAKKKNIANAQFKQMDCFDVENLKIKFDAIISRGIICSHYGEELTIEFLIKLKNILKPRGIIILDVLNKLAENKYAYKVQNKAYYTSDQISAIGSHCGFRRTKVYGSVNSRVWIVCLYV